LWNQTKGALNVKKDGMVSQGKKWFDAGYKFKNENSLPDFSENAARVNEEDHSFGR
jgi:hypothetical protein